ncbi:MAG: hypothetical protein ABR961_04210 [Thermoanaerobaculaceae bacterium]
MGGGRRNGQRERTRAANLRAAVDVFARRGYAAARTREVAARAVFWGIDELGTAWVPATRPCPLAEQAAPPLRFFLWGLERRSGGR